MKPKKEKRKDKETRKDLYNKCQNYHRNLSKIEANRLEYDEIMSDMYGVSLVVMKDVIMENAGDPGHVWDHYLVRKKDEFLLKRAVLPYDTVIINKALDNITDGEVADMTMERYIDRNERHDDAVCNHGRSKPTMYSNTNRAILSQSKK